MTKNKRVYMDIEQNFKNIVPVNIIHEKPRKSLKYFQILGVSFPSSISADSHVPKLSLLRALFLATCWQRAVDCTRKLR